ncbi:hypothetical protein PTNB85_09742 [Pyrenophora teres f. teres]|nr:hypothetical protein PTNB85_09742 [Pyrenophora teres f. teres]KAE8858579.1 hypothetical protein PTNB29_07794 [Pyrenophora teres f. teres]
MAMTPSEQKRSSTGSRVLGMTGPPGEAGLPPSRPSSIATANSSSQNRWSQASPARRGGGMSVAGSLGHHSRPGTAASRTHVPLAAHGFFRPMSSQRLQQQRNQRPTSLLGHSSLYADPALESARSSYRQSSGSAQTARGASGLHHELDLQPPPSRGTDITDRDMPDRTTANTTPTGAETVRSHGESITPLQRPRPQHLNLANVHDARLPTPSKSPRSFRSSFMLSSRDGRSAQMRPHQGHEKLTSAESSPRFSRREATKEAVKRELGKNYQYFSGNTAFCWGGRLQNTRDRPVNVATAILILLPAGLFFGFSAPWLWLHVSPSIPILFAYLLLVSFSSFMHASASDPGILPRNLHPFPPPNPNEDPLSLGPPTTEWTMVVSATGTNAAMEVPTNLGVYHLFLVGRGETTREYLNSHKFLKKDRHRPFTQGSVLKNWAAVLQRPRPPTYLHFKRKYEEGDQRFGPRKDKRTAPLAPEQQGGGLEMQDVRASEGFSGPAGRTVGDDAEATVN